MQNRSKKKALCLPLIDPNNASKHKLKEIVSGLPKDSIDAVLVGGSTVVDLILLNNTIKFIKDSLKVPVILFPNNITGISQYADAILYMILLNTESPYYLIEAQMLGSALIDKYKIEALPTSYLIFNEGSAAACIGHARPLPRGKPEIVKLYSLAAKYMGSRVLYLEAGSGSNNPVSVDDITSAKSVFDGLVIVGGGITSRDLASNAIKAGADGIIVGNLFERTDNLKTFISIVNECK